MTTEMRMIQMMSGKTLLDQILNSVLRGWIDVEDIEKHFKRHHVTCLGHLERMNVESSRRRVYEKIKVGNTKRGRLKKTWKEIVKHDTRKINLSTEDANDQEKHRHCCKQLDNSDILG